MSARRLQVSLKTAPAMTVRRVALDHERLVHVICADRKLRYANGKFSHIAYIGTTKKGLARVAGSAAYHAEDISFGPVGYSRSMCALLHAQDVMASDPGAASNAP